jgi:hypothetical protein
LQKRVIGEEKKMTTSLGSFCARGKSGRTYPFQAFSLDAVFDRVGAVYFITCRKIDKDGRIAHSRIYCGETADLSARTLSTEQATSFASYGANCICVFISEDTQQRHDVEKDIHQNYKLLCNGLIGGRQM